MRRKIIITETDNGVEVEQYFIDKSGDLHKDEEFRNQVELHHFFHIAMNNARDKYAKAKKEKKCH